MRFSLWMVWATGLLAVPASATVCEQGSVKGWCDSQDADRAKLCQLVKESLDPDEFKELDQNFIHLGSTYFLAEVNYVSERMSGYYLVNTAVPKMEQWGGWGSPSTLNVGIQPNGRCQIVTFFSVLSHGVRSEGVEIVEVRTNPLSGTPFLVGQRLGALPLDEAKQLVCSGAGARFRNMCANPKRFEALWKKYPQESPTAAGLLRADKAARAIKEDTSERAKTYEKAGILAALDGPPADMSPAPYASVLNNYGFYLIRNESDLPIEILDKVLRLAPDRIPAYLNMADAIAAHIKYREGKMPLDSQTMKKLVELEASYRQKHAELKKARSEPAAGAPEKATSSTRR